MSTLFEEVSKEVGWKERTVQYPTTGAVRQALARHNRQDIFNLVLWHRYLKNPETTRERSIINIIDDGLATMRI